MYLIQKKIANRKKIIEKNQNYIFFHYTYTEEKTFKHNIYLKTSFSFHHKIK